VRVRSGAWAGRLDSHVNGCSKGKAGRFQTPDDAVKWMAGKLKATGFESWEYQQAGRPPHLIVARYELPEGGKTYRPFCRTADGWKSGDPADPLPLYRLPELVDASGFSSSRASGVPTWPVASD
jgi:hypothetical protein